MKKSPMPKRRKIVVLGEIEIFFKDKVGILLTNNIATKIVKIGVIFLISKPILKFVNSKINGIKINNPPAGEGMPSKKLFFQFSVISIFVKLNLANRKTQQTE